jgi:hypothetical protein
MGPSNNYVFSNQTVQCTTMIEYSYDETVIFSCKTQYRYEFV